MDLKTTRGRAKARKRLYSNNRRCITCVQSCSMSGLCMKPWPEFGVVTKEGVKWSPKR